MGFHIKLFDDDIHTVCSLLQSTNDSHSYSWTLFCLSLILQSECACVRQIQMAAVPRYHHFRDWYQCTERSCSTSLAYIFFSIYQAHITGSGSHRLDVKTTISLLVAAFGI